MTAPQFNPEKEENMNPEQITALAREYAEESAQEAGVEFDPHDWAVANCVIETKDVIKFLLRRFCLVEKAKLEEEYHEAKFACGNVDPCSETWATYLAQKSLMERLFPEITKEVEE